MRQLKLRGGAAHLSRADDLALSVARLGDSPLSDSRSDLPFALLRSRSKIDGGLCARGSSARDAAVPSGLTTLGSLLCRLGGDTVRLELGAEPFRGESLCITPLPRRLGRAPSF